MQKRKKKNPNKNGIYHCDSIGAGKKSDYFVVYLNLTRAAPLLRNMNLRIQNVTTITQCGE